MSETETTKLGLPLIQAAEAQKHVTHNEAIDALDTLVHLAVLDRNLTVPPGSPAEGDAYIPASGASGDWTGRDNDVVAWQGGIWRHYPPQIGWRAFIVDEAQVVVWDGTDWTSIADFVAPPTPTELQNLTLLGLGTTADATNPFSAKLNNLLVSAKYAGEGGDGDLRYKLNKESAADTLSLLMQDDWSGRAELGLIGNDEFTIKTSADGTNWKNAIEVDADGYVKLPQRPLFMGQRDGSNQTASGAFVANSVWVDTASAYNTSNGRFTCPVSGVYQVHTGILTGSSPVGAGVNIDVRKNGALQGAGPIAWSYLYREEHFRVVGAALIEAATGDYLEAYVDIGGGGSVYGTGLNFLIFKQVA